MYVVSIIEISDKMKIFFKCILLLYSLTFQTSSPFSFQYLDPTSHTNTPPAYSPSPLFLSQYTSKMMILICVR